MEAVDTISCKPVPQEKLLDIVERLYTSETIASVGGKPPKKQTTNSVARAPASEEEMKEIYERLYSASTKGKSGQVCKTFDPMKPPGFGQKMLPPIEGLDERFSGEKPLPTSKVAEVVGTLHSTQTKASQARKDNHRHLLYPERTLLMNNVERIVAFQETGSLVKQTVLQRREKWYN